MILLLFCLVVEGCLQSREEQREDPAVLSSLLRIVFGQHGGTVIEKAKKMDGQSMFKGQEGEKNNSFRLKRRKLEIVDAQEKLFVHLRPFNMSRLFFVSLVFTSCAKARSQVT